MRKIFIIFGSLLVFLAAGEIFVRIFLNPLIPFYIIDKETLLPILTPNSKGYVNNGCYRNFVEINSVGFHDFEFQEEKPENTFRIVILGDSFTEARQVSRDESFFNLLEKKLNENLNIGKKFEVYSFGHSGNGTFLNNLYLKKYALKYKPDLVIDMFFRNDVIDDSKELCESYPSNILCRQFIYPKFDNSGKVDFSGDEIDLSKKIQSHLFIKKIISKSSLASFLVERYIIMKGHLQFMIRYIAAGGKNPDPFGEMYSLNYSENYQKAWLNEEALLKSIRDISSGAGSKFLLVSVAIESFLPEKLEQKQPKANMDFDKPEELLEEISQRNDFSYLDLAPSLEERVQRGESPTSFPRDDHWNKTGHQWAAETIFEYLKSHTDLLSK